MQDINEGVVTLPPNRSRRHVWQPCPPVLVCAFATNMLHPDGVKEHGEKKKKYHAITYQACAVPHVTSQLQDTTLTHYTM